jgi:hypothetical protein
VFTRLLRYILSIPTHGHKQVINRVLSVEELPQVDAGRVQAETAAGIWVEENGPVVKLLPEHDVGIPYGSVIVAHGAIFPSVQRAIGVPASMRTLDHERIS